MLETKMISRTLLCIEGLVLLLPSLFALLFWGGCLIEMLLWPSRIADDDFARILLLLPLLSFLSFWHLFADVLMNEFAQGKKQGRAIRFFCTLGVVGALTNWICQTLSISISSAFGVYLFGILYLPSYCHLLFEVEAQQRSFASLAGARLENENLFRR